MIGNILLLLHGIKSNSPMKKYLTKKEFAFWIAKVDGYYEKIPTWCW